MRRARDDRHRDVSGNARDHQQHLVGSRDAEEGHPARATRARSEVSYGAAAWRAAGHGCLKAPTLADALADSQQQGHIVTLSMKRASAAMLAGQEADAVTGWLQRTGGARSTAYAPAPGSRVLPSSSSNPVEADFGKSWRRCGKGNDYEDQTMRDLAKPPPEWDPTFPHVLQAATASRRRSSAQWERSPYCRRVHRDGSRPRCDRRR